MKKVKKLMAMLASASMLTTSLTAINSSALFVDLEGSQEYQKFIDGFDPIEDNEKFFSKVANDYYKFDPDMNYQVYAKPFTKKIDGKTIESFAYKIAVPHKSSVNIETKDDSNTDEILKIAEEFGFTDASVSSSAYGTDIYFRDKSPEESKELCNVLKEKDIISDFHYFGESISFVMPEFKYITCYATYSYDDPTILEEQLKNYIEEKNLDCELRYLKKDDEFWEGNPWCTGYCVIPNYEITASEHLKIAKQIYADLGIYPCSVTPCSNDTFREDSIDMFNEALSVTLAGDVNGDNAVNISDVVSIASYISNPETNPLNEQKIINGDVHNTGDGLTASDALMIQQYLAGIITEL